MQTQSVAPQQNVALFRAIATALLTNDKALAGQWDQVAALFVVAGKVDDEKFNATRAGFVGEYVIAANVKAVTSADVKASKGTQAEADAYDTCKRNARASFGMGTNRALARLGIERTKQNSGGKPAAPAEPATPATPESVTAIPVSIINATEHLRDAILHFQQNTNLTKAAKEAIGKIAAESQALLDAMNGKTPDASK